jgi:hypothetical protein
MGTARLQVFQNSNKYREINILICNGLTKSAFGREDSVRVQA